MNRAYTVDEQIEEGIKRILTTYLNDAIDANNATITDGITMAHIDADEMYDQFVPLPNIIEGKMKPFPSLCFYVDRSSSEIILNNKDRDTIQVRLALFTAGANSAILYKRYIATIRQVLEEHDDEIADCVFRGYNDERRYYPPTSYNSNEMVYIAEMFWTITVEVRK